MTEAETATRRAKTLLRDSFTATLVEARANTATMRDVLRDVDQIVDTIVAACVERTGEERAASAVSTLATAVQVDPGVVAPLYEGMRELVTRFDGRLLPGCTSHSVGVATDRLLHLVRTLEAEECVQGE